MIGSVALGWGGGRLGSCGLRSQECSGSRKRLGTLGWGRGGQALGFRTRGLKAGGGEGKPLEALFPPAVKGRRQKMLI